MVDYSADLHKILDQFEEEGTAEQHYLLQSHLKLINSEYELQCGLSPARTFTPVVIIQHRLAKIVCSMFKWADLITILQDLQTYFQDAASEIPPGESITNSDYMLVVRLTQRNEKKIMLIKNIYAIYLGEYELQELLHLHSALIRHHITLLNTLEFCLYYYILKILKQWLESNKTTLSVYEMLQGFSRG